MLYIRSTATILFTEIASLAWCHIKQNKRFQIQVAVYSISNRSNIREAIKFIVYCTSSKQQTCVYVCMCAYLSTTINSELNILPTICENAMLSPNS